MRQVWVVVMILVGFALGTAFGLTLARAEARPPAKPVSVPAEQVSEKADDKFCFGKVISVDAGQLVVKEYDFSKDCDLENAYTFTPDTELGNVNSLSDLRPGDDVVLDYVETGNRRVATVLVKEEKIVEPVQPKTKTRKPVPTRVQSTRAKSR